MYTAFAEVYDHLMADVPYQKWAEHYLRLLKKHGVEQAKCVECACGSGSLTIPLQKGGLKMTGVDVSDSMLAIALQKARENGVLIPFVKQDMCKLTLPTRVSAVLCTCDGVNYLVNEKKLKQFFSAAFQALKEGGVLVFDASTPYKLLTVLGNETRTFVTEDYAYIWHNKASAKNKTVTMELTIFSKDKGTLYNRVEEKQVQRAYTAQELTQALEQAGFEHIRFFGGLSLAAPKEQETRWHVVAIKPKH